MWEKIYCTRCGREIKDGLLYCDRCGQSVKKSIERQKPLKYRQIEEIHKERDERKQHRREEAAKRRQQKKKNLRRTRIIVVILLLLIIALISAVVAYIEMSKDSGMKDMDDVIQENVSATEAPAATESTNVVIVTTGEPESTSAADTQYINYSISGVTFSYPDDFTTTATENGETMRFADTEADGIITLCEESVSGDTKDLMLEYAADNGVEQPSYSRAGENWYSVTLEKDGAVTHRKAVIQNGTMLYYELSYSASSAKAETYEACITEMDARFSK